MKRRSSKLILAVIFVVICLSGCVADTGTEITSPDIVLPDTYVEGSDYQYMRTTGLHFPNLQKGEGGYYFTINNFLYFLDEETEKITCLCNQEGCLHDSKTCNAYLPNGVDSGIYWCNGFIYYLDRGPDAEEYKNPVLYRIPTDGSGKEKIYYWEDTKDRIFEWMVHRDVLYYIAQPFPYQRPKVESASILYAMPLTGEEAFTLHSIRECSSEGMESNSFLWLNAYGNHVYFSSSGMMKGWLDADDWRDYDRSELFQYNILSKETTKVELPGPLPKGSFPWIRTFWKDKMILEAMDYDKEFVDEGPAYISNLEGTEGEFFMMKKQAYFMDSDRKYLYMSNVALNDMGVDPEPKMYQVFDENLNIVDTFTVDEKTVCDFPVGLSDRAYRVFFREGRFGVEYWDKSVIGSLNGAEITWTEIPYERPKR